MWGEIKCNHQVSATLESTGPLNATSWLMGQLGWCDSNLTARRKESESTRCYGKNGATTSNSGASKCIMSTPSGDLQQEIFSVLVHIAISSFAITDSCRAISDEVSGNHGNPYSTATHSNILLLLGTWDGIPNCLKFWVECQNSAWRDGWRGFNSKRRLFLDT